MPDDRRRCRDSRRWPRRIVEAVVQPYEIDGYQIRSSVSIGIAVGPHDGDNADDLLMAADLALYAVKADGRGTYKFYNRAMNTELNDRRQIEMDLRDAIERNELELHYQPIIDLQPQRHHRLRGAGAMAPPGQGHGAAGRRSSRWRRTAV